MLNSASRTHVAPVASCTTFWVNRVYFSSRSSSRTHSASWLMPGLSTHTPTIIIRLYWLSIRSQAVSTLVMRSPVMPSVPLTASVTFFCTTLAALRAVRVAFLATFVAAS